MLRAPVVRSRRGVRGAAPPPKNGSGPPAATPVPGVSSGVAWLVAFTVFLSISRLHQKISILALLQVPLLLSVCSLVMLFASTDRWRPGDMRLHWIPKWLGLVTGIALLGVPFSIYPGHSVLFLYDVYSRAILLSVMVWAVSRSPEGMRLLVKTMVVSGVTTALLALQAGQVDNTGRLSGAYTYDPNDLALICVVTIPLTLWWIFDRASHLGLLLTATIPILLVVIIKSGSRGGFLALAMVLVGLLALAFQGRMPTLLRRVAFGTVIVGALAVPLLPGDYIARVMTIVTDEEDYNLTSATGRKAVWTRGMGYAFDYPLLGVGIDNFATAEGRLSDIAKNLQPGEGFKWSAPHNSFVQALAELGLIGGSLFGILLLRTTVALLRYKPPETADPGAPPGLLPPLLGVCFLVFGVGAFFLSFAYSDLLYILYAFACAVFIDGPRVEGLQGSTRPAGRRGTAPHPRVPGARRSPRQVAPTGALRPRLTS